MIRLLTLFLFGLLILPSTSFAEPSHTGSGPSSDVDCGEESDQIATYETEVKKQYLPHQPGMNSAAFMDFGAEEFTEFHKTAKCRTITAYDYSKRIFYIYAGVGLGVMVILAFAGRWQWKWFFAFVGGLFVVAAAQAVIEFLS